MLKYSAKYLQTRESFSLKIFPLPYMLPYNEMHIQLIWHVIRGKTLIPNKHNGMLIGVIFCVAHSVKIGLIVVIFILVLLKKMASNHLDIVHFFIISTSCK